ncbi:MAG: YIP1 family protein [Bryobacteraceae bacterium]
MKSLVFGLRIRLPECSMEQIAGNGVQSPKIMTPENSPAVAPAPAGMGEFSRITGVFFDPKKTFEDIAKRPTWIVPMVLIVIAILAVSIVMMQHIGAERIVRHSMDANPRVQQMPADQREAAVAMSIKFASVMAYSAVIFVPLAYVIISAVLLGVASGILSAGVRFKQVFAIVSYASLTGLISAALTLVVILLKNPDEFNAQNPLAFNPGAFMDPNTGSKFLYSLATSLDLFTLWTILLIAVGLKAAAGKKLTFGGALFAVVLPWAVWVLGKSALAGLFS